MKRLGDFLRFLCILGLLVISVSNASGSVFRIQNEAKLDGIYVSDFVDVLHFKEATTGLQELTSPPRDGQFEPSTGQSSYFFREGRFWFRIVLNLDSEKIRKIYLLHDDAYTDRISLYAKSIEDGRYQELVLGDQVPLDLRPVAYRNPVFPIDLFPGENIIYIAMENNGPLHARFSLWDPIELTSHIRSEYLFLGALFGVMLIMIGFNGLMAARYRYPEFLFFIAYVSCFTLVQLIETGIYHEVFGLHPSHQWVGQEGLVAIGEMSVIFAVLLANAFLGISRNMPSFFKLMIALLAISMINFGISFFKVNISIIGTQIINGLVLALLLGAGIKACLIRFRPSYLFSAACAVILLGSIFSLGRNLGLIAGNSIFLWTPFLSGCVAVMLLSLAIFDKMNLHHERLQEQMSQLSLQLEKAQHELGEDLKSFEALAFWQREASSKGVKEKVSKT